MLVITTATVTLSIVGFRSESHRVHIGIACLALALNLTTIGLLFDSLVPSNLL